MATRARVLKLNDMSASACKAVARYKNLKKTANVDNKHAKAENPEKSYRRPPTAVEVAFRMSCDLFNRAN